MQFPDLQRRHPDVIARLSSVMDPWLTAHQQCIMAEILGILGEDTFQPTAS